MPEALERGGHPEIRSKVAISEGTDQIRLARAALLTCSSLGCSVVVECDYQVVYLDKDGSTFRSPISC